MLVYRHLDCKDHLRNFTFLRRQKVLYTELKNNYYHIRLSDNAAAMDMKIYFTKLIINVNKYISIQSYIFCYLQNYNIKALRLH